MRKIHLVLVTLLILMPSLIVVFLNSMLARENPLPNNQGRVVAEATEGPIKLMMELNKTIYNIGENVSITIKVVNVSNSTIKLAWSEALAAFTVRNLYNTIYSSARISNTQDWFYLELEHGGSWNRTFVWEQRNMGGRIVPGGTYHIIAETPSSYGFLEIFEFVNGEWTSHGHPHIKTPALTILIS